MTMKRVLIITVLAAWTVLHLQAQRPGAEDRGYLETPDRKGKLFLVPEFWLSFGSSTFIEIAPLLGYHVNDRLSIGLGPHYIYQSWKASSYMPGSQTHVFGIKGFTRFALITHAEQFLPFNLFNELFVHVEYEGMSLENGAYSTVGNEARYFSNLFLVGGGFSQRIGMYNSVSVMVLWNLNESYNTPYSNPVFRIGFNAYF
jgi:hypothetical protein